MPSNRKPKDIVDPAALLPRRRELIPNELVDLDAERWRSLVRKVDLPFEPTPTQERFAYFYISEFPASVKGNTFQQMSKKAGIPYREVRHWFNDPGFLLWITEVRRQHFAFAKPMVDNALIKACLKGNVKAFQVFYTLTGELSKTTEAREIEKKVGASEDISEQFVRLRQSISRMSGAMGQSLDNVNPIQKNIAGSEAGADTESEPA